MLGCAGLVGGARIIYNLFRGLGIYIISHGCVSGGTEMILGGLLGVSLGSLLLVLLTGKLLFERNNYFFAILFSFISFGLNTLLLFNGSLMYVFSLLPSLGTYLAVLVLYLLVIAGPTVFAMIAINWKTAQPATGDIKNKNRLPLILLTILVLTVAGINFYFQEVRVEKTEPTYPLQSVSEDRAC